VERDGDVQPARRAIGRRDGEELEYAERRQQPIAEYAGDASRQPARQQTRARGQHALAANTAPAAVR
ncbi:MAG TPA: hypothetical protein VHB99_05850, partial [Pirellulales bacterium]|nr:hypothetical protein [Pirellulales bacterium]